MIRGAAQALSMAQRAEFEAMRRGTRSLAGKVAFDLALDHGVASALAAFAEARSQGVPSLWKARLRQLRAQQLQQRSCHRELQDRLESSGAVWMTARGWARTVDPILPIRPTGDVDLYTTIDQFDLLRRGLAPRWELERRQDDRWGTTRVLHDRKGKGPAVDVHFDFSLFGGRCPGAIENALSRRRQLGGLWLPAAEDDWMIALIESLQGLRQRSLRRHWERQGLAARLEPVAQQAVLQRFGLRPEVLYQLEQRLYVAVPESQALRRSMMSWLRASQAPVTTAAWLAKPTAQAVWGRLRRANELASGSS